MADMKAMRSIKTVLQTTQGATGEMLAEGLVHALQDRPEDRHDLQNALLKMVAQVLTSARSESQLEAEKTCQQKVDAAQVDLNTCKTAVANASEALAHAQANAQAKKEKLEECRRQSSNEEDEHKRVESLDQEKSNEVAVFDAGKQEVVALLEKMSEPGSGEALLPYLRSANAEGPLLAALQSVLKKEASDRIGFDEVALTHLQNFLEKKTAEWDSKIETSGIAKANIHAEALGAWAVKEVAKQHLQEAVDELAAAEKAVITADQVLKDAKNAEQQQDGVLAHYLTDLTLAGERVRQCGEALESLARLEAGQPMEVEVPPMATGMDIDMDAAKTDMVLDSEMGVAITA